MERRTPPGLALLVAAGAVALVGWIAVELSGWPPAPSGGVVAEPPALTAEPTVVTEEPAEPRVLRRADLEGPAGTPFDLTGETLTGQTWSSDFAEPASAASLIYGRDGVLLDSAGASYLWTTQPGRVGSATLTFAFGNGETSKAGVNLSFSKVKGPEAFGEEGVFTRAVHTTVTPSQVNVGAFDGPGNLRILRSIPLALDPGEEYELTITRTGADEVVVTAPNGQRVTISDAAISDLWGNTVGIEHFQPAETVDTDSLGELISYVVRAR